ncbi:DUF2635 domain-containing protein [Providencia hangzhouensis]|uniref:Protein of uncharacterized function (DUF2635) n=1 Tax=Providencia rettgeri TaxID=587 RepID=A0A9N8D288_PRORE|nr:DUF2635 domain-containing protein [Providencia rettgeri]CAB5645904.1 Protein of uncharacterised function (DUF2635) [Providencia rettgeri]CAB5713024.1 Protein of uncharacterised function (DUF2635) [Providencia rettgeri]CAC9220513.1 Protein of uncharacterised function (DUF2635) [Providencia rettgeri]CAC9269098.1 Protein of uncharacterised function (DUF2635) [Providencia rettgeri]
MTEIYIKPTEGLTVRDPETYQPLSIKGEKKPRNTYWLRRLKDGDVVHITQEVKKGK